MVDTDLIKAVLVGIVRWVLTLVLGGLVVKKYLTDDQLSAVAWPITGAIIILASIVWSKVKQKFKFDTAVDAPANASVNKIKTEAARANPLIPNSLINLLK